MLVITANTLPENIKITEIHGFVEYTHSIEISDKGFWRNLTEKKRNHRQEAFDGFVKIAESQVNGANLVYAVGMTTSTAGFNNGTFLIVTYYGTLATAVDISE